MSNRLITDSFPKTKKEKTITKHYRQTKLELQSSIKPVVYDKGFRLDQGDDELACLKAFDLESEYGPCIGITRMERWERAEKYGLHPPQEVKNIIQQHSTDLLYTECIWYDTNL